MAFVLEWKQEITKLSESRVSKGHTGDGGNLDSKGVHLHLWTAVLVQSGGYDKIPQPQ